MGRRPENLLLEALPEYERARLDPFLEPVEVELMHVFIEPNEPIDHMFFPYDAVTSTLQELADGSTIETGLMGIEGMIGIQYWLGVATTTTRTLVQVGGSGHVMSSKNFEREVMSKPESPLNGLISRYTHAFLCMTSQVAACNRLHTIDQRMCRWLKLIHNRVRRDEFPMRQEFMAQMLGVQRPTLSTAANILQKAGLITYSRGNLRVLDPDGLTAGPCECLEIMESQFDRVFDRPWRRMAEEEDAEAEPV